MSKAIRIRTKPGEDQYVSINLEQDFDQLNILSLTIDQEDAYRSFEANYGVVAGRIDINDGFGLHNAKVSIFIPIDEADRENEVINAIYPYRTVGDTNSLGKRYNLLPNKQQSRYHTPVGTFPSKREILDNSTMVEIYEKYYKFTTTTNEAGDYMFFGVPVGEQQIFIDIDVSDIGFLSVRPYDLIEKGVNREEFEDGYVFKGGTDLDKLPQVISKTEAINVLPFWSDDLEDDKKRVGITRFDYSVTQYELTPTAMFMGSLFSDNENDSLSKNCRPRKKMGRMNELITGQGLIEAITRTSSGDIVKSKDIPADAIDENGNWAIQLPMNIRKVVTDEFGALVPSPDGKKGVASEADYRFRISMGSDNGLTKKRTRAKMLVPNMTNNYVFDEFSGKKLKLEQEKGTPIFKINEQLSYFSEEKDPTIQYNYLEDFFTFRWKKIYTVRQYIPRYQPNKNEGPSQQNFIGFKQILDGNGVNKLPYNRLFTKMNPLYRTLCFILVVYGFIIAYVNSFIQVINSLISNICEFRVPFPCFDIGRSAGVCKKMKYKFEVEQWRKGGTLGTYNWRNCNTDDCPGILSRNFAFTNTCDDIKESTNDCYVTTDDKNAKNDDLKGCLRYGTNDRNKLGLPVHPSGNNNNWVPSYSTTTIKKDAGGTFDWWYETESCRNATIDGGTIPDDCIRVKAKDGALTDEYYFEENDLSCEKPDGTTGFAVNVSLFNLTSGVCIKALFYWTRIALIKGLCNRCTNDDEFDDGPKGPNNGVNKNCCSSCDDCRDNGIEIYYNQKQKDDGIKVYGCPKNCLLACCEKIAPIGLKCQEEGLITQPVLFATGKCGIDDRVRKCKTCSGVYWYGISNWVECELESLANNLGMLDFEFYNDWINGSLYFPLVKRKLKLRKGRKGKNQVKKDVFCDYDCDGTNNTADYQTPDEKIIYLVKLRGGGKVKDYDFEGCVANIPRRLSAKNWYETKSEGYREIIFNGYRGGDTSKPCQFSLADYCTKYGECDDNVKLRNTNKKIKIREKNVPNEHSKPKYIKVTTEGEDGEDIEVWKNFGGHGHHKNKCKENYLVDRLEYIKTDLSDCQVRTPNEEDTDDEPIQSSQKNIDEDTEDGTQPDDEQSTNDTDDDTIIKTFTSDFIYFEANKPKRIKHGLNSTNIGVQFFRKQGDSQEDITNWSTPTYRVETPNVIEVFWEPESHSNPIEIKIVVTNLDNPCELACATQGTAACSGKKGCDCSGQASKYNAEPIYRGLVREYDNEIYYASIVDNNDVAFNNNNYKKNMLFPTNITELGSSVTCDIDEAPFIIGDLEPTSYQVSEEELKSKGGRGTERRPYKLKERDSIVNLSAYVDFGCSGVRCMNVRSSLTSSQVGSDLFDLNDSGLECNSCSSYNDIDTDVRSYFCRRFSTFIPTLDSEGAAITDMKVNYVRPGGEQGENYYEPYGDVTPNCREEFNNKVAVLIDDDNNKGPEFIIDNDLNDGEPITPGDKCGYRESTPTSRTSLKEVKYFYGMDASSHTKKDLKDYPYNGSKLGLDGDIESDKLVDDDEGITATSTQTPYFFYFGLVPGKTALNKVVATYFADIINSRTLEDLSGDENSSGDGDGNGNGDDDDKDKTIEIIEGSCLKN